MAVKCILTGQTPSVLDGVTENVQTQIDNKQDKITITGILQGDGQGNITAVESIGAEVVTLNKSDVGLGNVDNTSDANKPISTATQTALDKKQDKLPSTVTLSNSEISLSSPLHGVGPTSFQILDDDNSFVSVTYSASEDVYYGFSAPLADSPADGQKPNEIHLARLPIQGSEPAILDFTTPVSLKNVADPTDWTDAANKQWTDTFVKNISETNIKGALSVNGILKGDGEGTVTAAEEAEVELVDLTIANVTGLQDALDANKGTAIAVTLASASWTGTAAPYTYTISNSAITATTNQELTPATDITADQLAALQSANIIDGGQAAGSMTLKAFGEKPSVDIPVRIIVKG